MNPTITEMRQAIATAIAALDSVTSCPTTITKITTLSQLPAVTVRYSGAEQEVIETGGGTDTTTTFTVEVVVELSDENTAAESLESIIAAILDDHRNDPTYGVFVDSIITASEEPRVVVADDTSENAVPLLTAKLKVNGTTEEY